ALNEDGLSLEGPRHLHMSQHQPWRRLIQKRLYYRLLRSRQLRTRFELNVTLPIPRFFGEKRRGSRWWGRSHGALCSPLTCTLSPLSLAPSRVLLSPFLPLFLHSFYNPLLSLSL